MYKNLAQYISVLEREGELLRVAARVEPMEEIAEIADRISKSTGGGKALLFENTGTGFPVAINLFGSDRRMSLALGVDSLDDIPARIEAFAHKAMSPKPSLHDKLSALPLLGELSRWFPRNAKGRGECQQVVLTGEDARMSLLPVLKCWEHDGGRFVTLPLVHTADPDTGARNVGMYRMQIFGDHSTGMHWHIHKTGARHYEAYRKRGERMPVSVCLGGDPVYTYSAVAPMPDGIDEYLLAGFLRGKPVRLVECVTNGLRVPADCDIVIEGYVDTAEKRAVEGPFGDHTGFYSLEDLYPVFHVTAITHRRGAIYPATIVGIPPQEDLYMARATEKIFLAPIRLVMQPELTDMYMPAEGTAHNLTVVNIRKSYPAQAAKVASSLWGAGQMMFNKYMVVTSTDADIRKPATLARLLRRADILASLIRGEGVLDVLDHATATTGTGGKLALDLTAAADSAVGASGQDIINDSAGSTNNANDGAADGVPPSGNGATDVPLLTLPTAINATGGINSWDVSLLPEWGIVILYAAPDAEVDMGRFLDDNGLGDAKIAVLVDEMTAGLTPAELLWIAAANSDPARDASLHGGTLAIDARTKLPGCTGNPARFPNVAASSQRIIELVDSRWHEYGLGEFILSPSHRYRKLLLSDKAEI